MKEGRIENPFREKEVSSKMGKKKSPRLPETGEGNRAIEFIKKEDGRVTMRVLGLFVTYGYYTDRNTGKTKFGKILDKKDSRTYDPVSREVFRGLMRDAREQAFAILSKEAVQKNPVARARKIQREQDPRQADLF